MDIGGHRFFSKDERVNALWAEWMPAQGAPAKDSLMLKEPFQPGPGADPEAEDVVMLRRRRVSRIFYGGHFFDYPISMNASTLRSMGFGTTVAAGCSYLWSCVHRLPETSLENFYINRFGRKLYSMFFESYTEKLWGRHPSGISAEWGSQRVKGLSVRAVLKDMWSRLLGTKSSGKTETSLIESFLYPKYGPGQLWTLVADKVKEMGGEIRLNTKVTGLAMEGGRVKGVTLADGTVLEADHVISSMPVQDLILGTQNVPEDVVRIAKGLPYRDFVTVGLLVDRLALKNETKYKTLGNIVPDCWIYVQDGRVKLGRIQIFNNWSPYMTPDPVHQVWIGLEYFCREGDADWQRSDKEWAEFAAGELRRMGVLDSPVLMSHTERVKKAYPAYFDTYAEFDTLRAWLDSFENLYCVGRNGQHRYNNMDHSMVTAVEAARCILSGCGDHAAVWNVNTEQEYHEEKTGN